MIKVYNKEIHLKKLNLRISYQETLGPTENCETLIFAHGWLDNSNSFLPTLDFFEGCRCICIDFPGHGYSEHLSFNSEYSIDKFIECLYAFINELNLNTLHFVGHSLGAGVFSFFAAIFPEYCKSLTLIDGLGPFSGDYKSYILTFRDHIIRKYKKPNSNLKKYRTIQEAAAVRANGNDLKVEHAEILVSRGLCKEGDSFYWSSDPRLLSKTIHPYSEKEVKFVLSNIKVSTLLIMSKNSRREWSKFFDSRMKYIKNIKSEVLDGGHHLHMENPKDVASLITKHII